MATTATRGPRAEVGAGRLWAGLLLGPAAWKLQLMTNYALVPYACWHDVPALIHGASLATLLAALGGGWLAWGSWRRTGVGFETETGGPEGRSRFLALAGVATSGYFALVILGQWLPNVMLGPCDGLS